MVAGGFSTPIKNGEVNGASGDAAAMNAFRAADRQVGGAHLSATVVYYLQSQVAPRLFGATADDDGPLTYCAAAALIDMAGWMAHDADRSMLAQAGIPLVGPPVAEVFSPIAPQALAPALVDSIRWHRAHPEHPSDSVLNACRSLRFATEGRWSSKPAAGRWAVDRGLAPPELVQRACAGELGSSLAPVDDFLAEVESALSA